MLDAAAIERRRVVAELGPGTGVFTDEIVCRLGPDAKLLVLEIDGEFAAALRTRIRDTRVTVIHGSAADLPGYLDERGLDHVDCVLSGLPFTSLPRPLTHAILQAVRTRLAPGGLFVTYQYTPLLLGLFQTYFPATRVARWVLRNLPPALVFVCAVR